MPNRYEAIWNSWRDWTHAEQLFYTYKNQMKNYTEKELTDVFDKIETLLIDNVNINHDNYILETSIIHTFYKLACELGVNIENIKPKNIDEFEKILYEFVTYDDGVSFITKKDNFKEPFERIFIYFMELNQTL